MNKGVVLISHGSRLSKTKEEVIVLVDKLKALSGIDIIEYAFLEIESPSIPEGIERCISKGANNVIVLLNFLNAGRHVDVDIPAIVKEVSLKYPAVNITITKPVGQHERITDLFLDLMA